jgi:DNA-binding transcriptional regulator YiaG
MTGAEFRVKRIETGLTMAAAARLSGTPYRTWQDWEGGKRRVPGIAISWLEMYQKIQASSDIIREATIKRCRKKSKGL